MWLRSLVGVFSEKTTTPANSADSVHRMEMVVRVIVSAMLIGSVAPLACLAADGGAPLYQIEWPTTGGGGFRLTIDDSNTKITTAPHVQGSKASELAFGVGPVPNPNEFTVHAVKSVRFSNQEPSFTAVDKQELLDGKYWTFTVRAEDGYKLHLRSLDFSVRRGAKKGLRGFEIWGVANGGKFDVAAAKAQRLMRKISDTNTPADAPEFLPLNYELHPLSIDLSKPEFQGVQAITFRVFGLFNVAHAALDFGTVTLNGTAVQAAQ